MKAVSKLIYVCLSGALILVACKAGKTKVATTTPAPVAATTNVCTNTAYTYDNDIKSIIDNNCAKTCHSASNHASGINLSTHELVKEEALKSRFMQSLKHEGWISPMPKKSPKLSDSTLNVLSCWIENGCK
ncbi:MAG: hypothetical protein IT245_04465 [Bacteroidia bacterium]|nr:hypothetical protein [Bacteroidia bacterium]